MTRKYISIPLCAASIDSARILARRTQNLYKEQPGPYGDNSIEMHTTGKLGEIAISNLLKSASLEVKDDFAKIDRQSRTDLKVRIRRSWFSIEVKTFVDGHWDPYGRVISESQVGSISHNSDFIFWCCTSPISVEETALVRFMGYSPVADLLDLSTHCSAYKSKTIQFRESSLRRPQHFCQDLEENIETRHRVLLADRRVTAERLQAQRSTIPKGPYYEQLISGR